jgi:hypothetical protein
VDAAASGAARASLVTLQAAGAAGASAEENGKAAHRLGRCVSRLARADACGVIALIRAGSGGSGGDDVTLFLVPHACAQRLALGGGPSFRRTLREYEAAGEKSPTAWGVLVEGVETSKRPRGVARRVRFEDDAAEGGSDEGEGEGPGGGDGGEDEDGGGEAEDGGGEAEDGGGEDDGDEAEDEDDDGALVRTETAAHPRRGFNY